MNEIDTAAHSESTPRRGFLRASVYFVLIVFYTAVVGVPCLLFMLVNPRGESGYWFVRTWARLLLWTCGVHVMVAGREHVCHDGPFLIMSTHNSHFDIPVLIQQMPRQFRVVGKKSLFKIPVFGWVMSVAGYVSVDREDRKKAFASLDRAAESVRNGMPFLIFPEGTRSEDGSLGPFKKGGFVLAVRAGVPVVPVVIDGTFRVLPKSTWRICPGPVNVTFGPPIDVSAYSYESKEALMEEVRKAMTRIRDSAGQRTPVERG